MQHLNKLDKFSKYFSFCQFFLYLFYEGNAERYISIPIWKKEEKKYEKLIIKQQQDQKWITHNILFGHFKFLLHIARRKVFIPLFFLHKSEVVVSGFSHFFVLCFSSAFPHIYSQYDRIWCVVLWPPSRQPLTALVIFFYSLSQYLFFIWKCKKPNVESIFFTFFSSLVCFDDK